MTEEKKTEPVLVAKADAVSLAPVTTEQEDMTLAGQRRINLIWEFTQATIALTVIIGYVGVVMYCAVSGKEFKMPESLTNILFVILAFYFSRTNHAAIGGVGPKVEGKYVGR